MFYFNPIMKKILILVIAAAAIAVAFSGCASTKKSRASKSTAAKTEASEKTTSSTSAKRPNPYVDYDSQEKAEASAGFKLSIPSTLPFSYTKKISRAIPNEMIEIIYTTENSASYIDKVAKEGSSSTVNNNANSSTTTTTVTDDEVRLRKAKGSDDISGDITKYLITKNMAANMNKVESKRVELRGEVDNYHVATWVDGPYTYAITSKKGLTEKQILAFADQLY